MPAYLSLATPDVTLVLHRALVLHSPVETSPAASVAVENHLLRADGGVLCAVDSAKAKVIFHNAIDDWLPGILAENHKHATT